jgi:hypothetical protein
MDAGTTISMFVAQVAGQTFFANAIERIRTRRLGSLGSDSDASNLAETRGRLERIREVSMVSRLLVSMFFVVCCLLLGVIVVLFCLLVGQLCYRTRMSGVSSLFIALECLSQMLQTLE